jgi:hypothetical protein
MNAIMTLTSGTTVISAVRLDDYNYMFSTALKTNNLTLTVSQSNVQNTTISTIFSISFMNVNTFANGMYQAN